MRADQLLIVILELVQSARFDLTTDACARRGAFDKFALCRVVEKDFLSILRRTPRILAYVPLEVGGDAHSRDLESCVTDSMTALDGGLLEPVDLKDGVMLANIMLLFDQARCHVQLLLDTAMDGL